MKDYSKFEIVAVVITAFGKFLFMNYLDLELPFIIVATSFWSFYTFYRWKLDDNIFNIWGFSKENRRKTFLKLLPYAIGAALLFIVIGSIQGVQLFNWHILPVLILYPLWGLVQQFLMMSLVAGNMHARTNPRFSLIPTIFVSACLFGILHYPSPALMLATTLMAAIYTFIFLKWRSLWALGFYHGVLGGLFYFYVLQRDAWVEVFSAMG